MKKYSVRLNNVEKIEQLLQENYDLACYQYNQIQTEINKISNSTILNELDIDGKEKYGKIMSNYLNLQQKSTLQKFDIAKLMSEVLKHQGNVDEALNDMNKSKIATTLDLSKLREIAKNASTRSEDKVELYNIK